MRPLNTFDSWAEVAELVDRRPPACSTPCRVARRRRRPDADRPTMRQRVNIGLVTMFSQAIQITLVGARP